MCHKSPMMTQNRYAKLFFRPLIGTLEDPHERICCALRFHPNKKQIGELDHV